MWVDVSTYDALIIFVGMSGNSSAIANVTWRDIHSRTDFFTLRTFFYKKIWNAISCFFSLKDLQYKMLHQSRNTKWVSLFIKKTQLTASCEWNKGLSIALSPTVSFVSHWICGVDLNEYCSGSNPCLTDRVYGTWHVASQPSTANEHLWLHH